MWKKLCITVCAVFCVALAAVPYVFADDSSADSSASSEESSLLGDAGKLHDSVSSNFSDGVDRVTDTLKDPHGALEFNVKDQFPKFIKEATEWVPLPYWWAFEFAIILGFVNALYRRMS
ncbi:hypothetical protein [Gemmiger sp.]